MDKQKKLENDIKKLDDFIVYLDSVCDESKKQDINGKRRNKQRTT